MENIETIKQFVSSAKYYMIKYHSKEDEEIGKILTNEELQKLNLKESEIHRSIEEKNGDTLFVFDLLPRDENHLCTNPFKLLLQNIEELRTIETIYPKIFLWRFDGVSIQAIAKITSSDMYTNTTLTRYGGTEMFIRILRQHLKTIAKMRKGLTPDYNFLQNNDKIEETVLSTGSINSFNDMYCIYISPTFNFKDILINSKNNINDKIEINVLDLKYWSREINPDFITEAKHIKLENTIPIDETMEIYPPCIKNLMALKKKGNYNRFLLSKFLLSIHKQKDAKFVYDLVMADEELQHIKLGNCSTQWRYITNNFKKYSCPTCNQMYEFCDKRCMLTHPLEEIEKKQKNGTKKC